MPACSKSAPMPTRGTRQNHKEKSPPLESDIPGPCHTTAPLLNLFIFKTNHYDLGVRMGVRKLSVMHGTSSC